MGNENFISKHYKIMAGFALDFYMESDISIDINPYVRAVVDDNIETVIDKIAEVIDEKVKSNHKFSLIVNEVFLNDFCDYMYHFMFCNDVANFDKEIEDFILLCANLANKQDIKSILDKLLMDNKFFYNDELNVYILEDTE